MAAVERVGAWQQTYTGRMFWAQDPRPEDVFIEDIARALAMQCRFAGHCKDFYSVAQHCVLVSQLVEDQFRAVAADEDHVRMRSLEALLHDSAEAYIGDLVRPLKHTDFGKGYLEIEKKLTAAIAERFGVTLDPQHESISEADRTLLVTEKRDLLAPPPAEWTYAQGHGAKPIAAPIRPWSWEAAEGAFLDRFEDLNRGR